MTVSMGITGRSIQVSLEEYLRMTDEDFQDPFTESCLLDLKSEDLDEAEETDDSLFPAIEISEMLNNDSFGDC